MAEEICSRTARTGRSMPAINTMVSIRDSVSRGEFEWMVVNEPSWPVFIAWSMSSASPPRASPTMIRSGRMRSAFRTRSRIETSPLPSRFAGRCSMESTWSWLSCSSAASSMVTIRSLSGMKLETTLSIVVLPDPVDPLTIMLIRPVTLRRSNPATWLVMVPFSTRSSTVNGSTANFRMVRNGPPMASGWMTALTRDPSGSRASTIGLDSSMRRPTWPTIFSMIRSTWVASTNLVSVRWMMPARSTHTWLAPLTITSVTLGSCR